MITKEVVCFGVVVDGACVVGCSCLSRVYCIYNHEVMAGLCRKRNN
jgi:hypothetical protein